MKVTIKRFDKEIPLPDYTTSGSAAMDGAIREDAAVPPQGVVYVPLNIAIQPPPGHWVLMAARSSLHKRGLMLANNIAIFDEDFSGDGDEYKVALYNFSSEAVTVKRGERLVQLIVLPFDRIEWEEVEMLENKDRGGFGSTGI